jgi:hypothetical protein
MVMELDIQPMKASTVANHGRPRIRGWPPRLVLGCKMTKSVGYSHESTKMTKSSITPSGLMVEQSTNSKIVGVGQTCILSCNNYVVSIGIILISAPKSTNTWGIGVWPILIVIVGFSGSPYLMGGVFPNISSDKSPTTCTMRGSLGFLLGLLILRSLTVLA